MNQPRLWDLALLNAKKRNKTENADFEDMNEKFTLTKGRKIPFSTKLILFLSHLFSCSTNETTIYPLVVQLYFHNFSMKNLKGY